MPKTQSTSFTLSLRFSPWSFCVNFRVRFMGTILYVFASNLEALITSCPLIMATLAVLGSIPKYGTQNTFYHPFLIYFVHLLFDFQSTRSLLLSSISDPHYQQRD